MTKCFTACTSYAVNGKQDNIRHNLARRKADDKIVLHLLGKRSITPRRNAYMGNNSPLSWRTHSRSAETQSLSSTDLPEQKCLQWESKILLGPYERIRESVSRVNWILSEQTHAIASTKKNAGISFALNAVYCSAILVFVSTFEDKSLQPAPEYRNSKNAHQHVNC